MISIRALARAAPRTASRLTATKVARPSFQAAIRSPITSQLPRIAAFSSSRFLRDEYSQQLAAKLSSEIQIETSDADEDSSSIVDNFKAENPDWTIEDTVGEQEIFLTRKFDDETITVHFSIADFNTPVDGYDEMDAAMGDEEDMEMQSGGANTKGAINQGGKADRNFKIAPEDSIAPADREEFRDEEDEPSPAFPVNVQVLIQRPNKGALRFALVASDGDFMIHQIVQLPQSFKPSADAKELLRDVPESLYFGPPFQQLDEEVQGMLESYLNARGITNYLATFIPDYIDVKEQKEYLNWLGRVKEFVD